MRQHSGGVVVQVRAEVMLGLRVAPRVFAALFASLTLGGVKEDAQCWGRPLFPRVREGVAARMVGLPHISEGREEEVVGPLPLASLSCRERINNRYGYIVFFFLLFLRGHVSKSSQGLLYCIIFFRISSAWG